MCFTTKRNSENIQVRSLRERKNDDQHWFIMSALLVTEDKNNVKGIFGKNRVIILLASDMA